MWYKKPSKEELNAQLIEAAEAGNIKNVKKLLKQGAEVDARDNYGWTALMRAAMWGHLDVVKFLAELGADVNARDKLGWTALMRAAMWGHLDVAKFLVDNGADLSAMNNEGKTAATIAREDYQYDIADYLDHLDSLARVKERIDSVRKSNGSGLELRQEIRDILRTGKEQEYSITKHGVSY